MPCCYMNESVDLCLIFRANPNIDLKLDCIFGKPIKRRFQRYLVRTEKGYCQLSTYESNTFLCEKYVILPIQTNGVQMLKNPPNSPFLFGQVNPI